MGFNAYFEEGDSFNFEERRCFHSEINSSSTLQYSSNPEATFDRNIDRGATAISQRQKQPMMMQYQ